MILAESRAESRVDELLDAHVAEISALTAHVHMVIGRSTPCSPRTSEAMQAVVCQAKPHDADFTVLI